MICFLQAASFSSRLTEAENSIGELTTFSKSNGEVMTALQVTFATVLCDVLNI